MGPGAKYQFGALYEVKYVTELISDVIMKWMRVFTKFALGAPVSLLGFQRSEMLFPCILRRVTIALSQLPPVMSLSLIFFTSKT